MLHLLACLMTKYNTQVLNMVVVNGYNYFCGSQSWLFFINTKLMNTELNCE